MVSRTTRFIFASILLMASFAYSSPVFDSKWANMGGVSPSISIRGIAFASAQEFYAFGDFDSVGNVPVNKIAKWTRFGWQTPITGKTWNKVSALAVDRNGHLIVSGECDTPMVNILSGLALWSGSGWVPIPLSAGGSVVMILSDNAGNVIAGGTFTTIGGVPANSIAKWDGFAWSALGTGTDSCVCAMALDNNTDAFYVASQGRNSATVNKWIGGTWSQMSIYNMESIDALAVAPNGDLLVVGMTPGAGPRPQTFMEYNGTSWSSLGSSPGDQGGANSICFDAGGTLFAGGGFKMPGGGWTWFGAASWNGQSWKTYDIPDDIYLITKSPSGSLFACGDYGIYALTDTTWSKAGAPASNNAFTCIARDESGNTYLGSDTLVYAWDGLVFKKLGLGLPGLVSRLRMDSKGVLYAAGNHSGSIGMDFVQKWNGVSWVSMGVGTGGGPVYGMDIGPNDKVYIISSCFVMRWDDTGWTKLGLSFTNNKAGTAISFDNIGNVYKANNGDIWVENDTGWVIPSFWGIDANLAGLSATDMFFDHTGKAYIVGLKNKELFIMKQENGPSFKEIGKFYASEFDPQIYSHCFDSKNNLYVSGYFDGIHNQADSFISVKDVVMWDGASWNSLGIGVGDNTNYYGIKDIAVDADDRVYIAGMFDKAGGMVCSNFSVYCASGIQSGVLPRANPIVRPKASVGVSVGRGELYFRNISPQDRIYAYSLNGRLLWQSSGKPVIELHCISRQPLLVRIVRNAKVVFSKMIAAR